MAIFFHESRQEFHLQTKSSSYIFRVHESGHIIHLYYGPRLRDRDHFLTLEQAYSLETGSTVAYQEGSPYSMMHGCYEYPFLGKGDYREPAIEVEFDVDGSRLMDLHYVSHQFQKGNFYIPGLPSSKGDHNVESIGIKLQDKIHGLCVELKYTVYEDCNVISRHTVIHNTTPHEIRLHRSMSMSFDLQSSDYRIITLDGAWIRERHLHEQQLGAGIHIIDSKKGVSGSDHNPFIALAGLDTGEHSGKVIGLSLVYSGDFRFMVEKNPFDLVRIQAGINPITNSFILSSGDQFYTPEAVMTFSNQGFNGMSHNWHSFIQTHIVRGVHQYSPRPIVANNWEATYFKFDESRIMNLARHAKRLGVELFVLDDGWFGTRNNDQTSLGDWTVNRAKIPSGIDGLSRKIKKLGLQFGLWVEPEMVSVESELYRQHPEWAVQYPQYFVSKGRHQLLLDLANPAVVDYLYTTLATLFEEGQLDYVKWDMNRNFSDCWSNHLPKDRQGEFVHRYYLGLYNLLERLTQSFPNILFESCASGGNRFDLGMLCYMPQIWTSDNTDAYERQKIQYGTSLLYPPSVMGCHVSGNVNFQVMRSTPLESRFNVAAYGLLGYELDLSSLSPFERSVIRRQIVFYKQYRNLFQYGHFIRIESPFLSNRCLWMVVNEDRSQAIYGYYQKLMKPNPPLERLPLVALAGNVRYRLSTRPQFSRLKTFGTLINMISPISLKEDRFIHNSLDRFYRFPHEIEAFEVEGDELLAHGFAPMHHFTGSGATNQTRIVTDFGSRLYLFEKDGESNET